MSNQNANIKNILNSERFRFILVGGTNTFLGFVVFALIDTGFRQKGILNGEPALASIIVLTISHLVVSIPAFYLYRVLVFKSRGKFGKEFLRFQSIYVLPLSLNFLALPALVLLGINAIFAQAAIITLNVCISFLGHKYFTFRRTGK